MRIKRLHLINYLNKQVPVFLRKQSQKSQSGTLDKETDKHIRHKQRIVAQT